MNLIKATFITHNSIGKISKITKDIFNRGINISKSQMITHRNLLIFNTEYSNKNTDILKDIIDKYTLNDLGEIFKYDYEPYHNYYYKNLQITCADTPGIIHIASDLMRNMNINIHSLDSNCKTIPITCAEVFNLNMCITVPQKIKVAEIEDNIKKIKDKYGIDYKLNFPKNY